MHWYTDICFERFRGNPNYSATEYIGEMRTRLTPVWIRADAISMWPASTIVFYSSITSASRMAGQLWKIWHRATLSENDGAREHDMRACNGVHASDPYFVLPIRNSCRLWWLLQAGCLMYDFRRWHILARTFICLWHILWACLLIFKHTW
jgi:hypothetical protein